MPHHTSPARRQLLRSSFFAAFVGHPLVAMAQELVVPGSGNPESVVRLLANAYNRQQSQHKVSVPATTGTAGAIRDVLAGTAVLGRVGRPLKPEERDKGLVFVPIGRDPVAFVGGAGVTVKGLSQAQVLDIYAGKLHNWRELGGKPLPIRPIGRESTDASRQAIDRAIKSFATLAFSDRVKVVHLDPQMLELLDRFAGSLGFINRSALAACKTAVVPLALDGVEPAPQHVGVGRYPLSIEFGFVHKSNGLSTSAKAFIEFVHSSAGVGILRGQGVLSAAGSA